MIALHRKSCEFYCEYIRDTISDEDDQILGQHSKVFTLKFKPKLGLFNVLYKRCKKGVAIGVRIFDEIYPDTQSEPVKLSYEGYFLVVGCGQSLSGDEREVELVCTSPITTRARKW